MLFMIKSLMTHFSQACFTQRWVVAKMFTQVIEIIVEIKKYSINLE